MKTTIKTLALSTFFIFSTSSFSNEVNIEGINRIKLIQELYAHAKPLLMHHLLPPRHLLFTQLSTEEAEQLLNTYIDYLGDRVMKIQVDDESGSTTVNTYLYNRDNGQGAAESIIERLRSQLENK